MRVRLLSLPSATGRADRDAGAGVLFALHEIQSNLLFGYTAIPNPNLKPETSNGTELGVRYLGPTVYGSLGGYYNDYKDFIESSRYVGTNAQGLMVFQSQNVADAQIHGCWWMPGAATSPSTGARTGATRRHAASSSPPTRPGRCAKSPPR